MKENKPVYLTCKDHTVSQEKFNLVFNEKWDMLETYPQPEAGKLAAYYESENYISHTDSKKSFIDKLYQIVKSYSIKRKYKLINSSNIDEKTLLDVGCGTGDFLRFSEEHGWKVSGVEPNENARNLAKSKLKNHVSSEVVSDLEEVNSEVFDVITLWHVLEHVPNLEAYISKLKNKLKPSGVLIIAVPNFKSFDANYYKEFWAAFDVPRHLWHFSKKSIYLIFENIGMKVVNTLPMIFDSFYVSLLSEKYKTGKSNFIKAIFIGLVSNLKAMKSNEYSSQIYFLKKA